MVSLLDHVHLMTNATVHSAPVAIVGGGPVGLMLALFLDRLGVASVLFNTEATTRWHPRGSTHGSRTMEHYRRLGLAGAIRRLGLPLDHPTDVAYFTRFNGPEIARLTMPSALDVEALVAAAAKTDQVPEPIHRANQMHVERYLFEQAATRGTVTMRFGWHVERFDQNGSGVTLTATRDGATETWRTAYVVGCDGGRSMVRRDLGIGFRGESGLEQRYFGGRWFSTYVRVPELYEKYLGHRRAWQYWTVNPDRCTTMIAVDGGEEFLFRTQAATPDSPPDDATVIDALHRCIGQNVAVDVLGHAPWTAGVALVAERFLDRRVLLAGDAIHLFTPTGGFGMNTGIDDVSNLSWKLAAMLQGWGGAGLLASYETERMPIALRNTDAARRFAVNIGEMAVHPAIEDHSEAGAQARRAAAQTLSTFGDQFGSLGVQLGARYDGSSLIAADGAPPPDRLTEYVPSGVPGGRAPHMWLDSRHAYGASLYDRLGDGFTLLRLGSRASDGGEIVSSAARLNIPLTVLAVEDGDARDLYGCDLVLVRPDQYIAWRGNTPPADTEVLLRRVAGSL
jgi:2-polyprenyl-6-methoxyphenol hydroxylase-like FAD-dependent oxidoreductase